MPDDPDWNSLFLERILPAFAVKAGGQDQPRCVFVTGHQGSGKTTTLQRLLTELGPEQTQSIVPDALLGQLDVLHGPGPDATQAFDAYRRIHCATHCERLADHAVAKRAHILWERAIPGNIERIAIALRRLGYRVECLALATPVPESWLATLHRSLAASASGNRAALHVSWPILVETALRWPVLLDRAESALLFDRIAVLDRDGETAFDNHVIAAPDQRLWSDPAFAFESLLVERARARPEAALAALLADWDQLAPQIAAAEHPAWPPDDQAAFDLHLRALVADPGSRFDLDGPDPDPAAAQAWIGRLASDLAAVRASPEARDQPTLASRSERLLGLVRQVSGQPIR